MSDNCGMCNGKLRDEVKWVTMCPAHQAEVVSDDARWAGIPDLRLTTAELEDSGVDKIREWLKANPTKYMIVKIIQVTP